LIWNVGTYIYFMFYYSNIESAPKSVGVNLLQKRYNIIVL